LLAGNLVMLDVGNLGRAISVEKKQTLFLMPVHRGCLNNRWP